MARGVLGEDLFAHDVAIRKPLPTGKKDWTRLGGYLHADWHHFTVTPFLGGKHYPMAVQSAWCISEFTRENGATLIWPGSHLSLEVPPEQPETLPPGYLYTEAPAGSVILLGLGAVAYQWHQLRHRPALLAGVLLPPLVASRDSTTPIAWCRSRRAPP